MEKAKVIEDFITWQTAHEYILEIYKAIKIFPREKMFGLTSLLIRPSVFIAAKIEEDFRKKGNCDKVRFFNIATGSIYVANAI